MSSILLSNPFVTTQPASGLQQTAQTAAVAITPVQTSPSSDASNDATSYSGSGGGGNKQAETAVLLQGKDSAKWSRPAEATSSSVVDARTSTNGPKVYPESGLPEVEMPDPLPTSPFLKPNNFVG